VLKHIEYQTPCTKPFSGIVRIEEESGVCQLHLSLVNIPNVDGAEFFIMIIDKQNKKFVFSLGTRPTRFTRTLPVCPDLENGICAGIYVTKNAIPLTLAYASTDAYALPLSDFKKSVAEKCIEDKQTERKTQVEQPFHMTKQQNEPLPYTDCSLTATEEFINFQPTIAYNDEAVATENYYCLEQDITTKLDKLKELDSENLQFENELSFTGCTVKTQKEYHSTNGTKNETNFGRCQKDNERPFYYATVQRELTEILKKFPVETPLKNLFTGSSFVRINYSKHNYYVVGLIKENGKEKYICYGVPAEYSKTPPEQLKGFCSFVPASLFNMTGDGYWMMFQDAQTGDCIKMP
jgi:hypothetical protein